MEEVKNHCSGKDKRICQVCAKTNRKIKGQVFGILLGMALFISSIGY